MHLDTITKGEELLKKAAAVKCEGSKAGLSMGKCVRYVDTEPEFSSSHDTYLLEYLWNHASELLQCAREVEGLKARIEVLENPLPTQEEEREFYHRAYHVCHTGCPMPCPNRT